MPTARTTGRGAATPSSESTISRMVMILRMSTITPPTLTLHDFRALCPGQTGASSGSSGCAFPVNAQELAGIGSLNNLLSGDREAIHVVYQIDQDSTQALSPISEDDSQVRGLVRMAPFTAASG